MVTSIWVHENGGVFYIKNEFTDRVPGIMIRIFQDG